MNTHTLEIFGPFDETPEASYEFETLEEFHTFMMSEAEMQLNVAKRQEWREWARNVESEWHGGKKVITGKFDTGRSVVIYILTRD